MRMRRSVSGWKIIIIKRKYIRNVRIIFASCSFKTRPTITLSDKIQVEAKSIFVFGAAGHVIRIFLDMNVTSPEYLSG